MAQSRRACILQLIQVGYVGCSDGMGATKCGVTQLGGSQGCGGSESIHPKQNQGDKSLLNTPEGSKGQNSMQQGGGERLQL